MGALPLVNDWPTAGTSHKPPLFCLQPALTSLPSNSNPFLATLCPVRRAVGARHRALLSDAHVRMVPPAVPAMTRVPAPPRAMGMPRNTVAVTGPWAS